MEKTFLNTAVYHNRATGETYRLCGIKDLVQAWDLAPLVCTRNNWNLSMFSYDVQVKLIKRKEHCSLN